MEEEIIRRAQLRGIHADLFQVALTDEELFGFAQKAYAIVKEFSSLNAAQHPSLGLGEYTVNNVERLFKAKGKSADTEFSKFVSLFASHRQAGEIELYRELYQFNISVKAAQTFIRFFLDVLALNQHLYANKARLLQHVKLDTLQAKEMAASILRKDAPVAIFNGLVLKYMEDHTAEIHKLRADVAARFLVEAYFHNHIKRDQGADGQDLLLNWNSQDPNVFEIKVKKPEHPSEKGGDGASQNGPASAQLLEQINADFHKKNGRSRQEIEEAPVHATATAHATAKTHATATSNAGPGGKDRVNLSKICHDYVLGESKVANKVKAAPPANDEYSEAADAQLNRDLERLRRELNQRKNETELEKNVWKLVLNNSKAAIKNYAELKKEISITEGLAEALLNIAEQGTDEWKTLYDIRNHDVGELYRYKFLIAALLENCLQDLDKDIQGFKFSHDEPSHKMNKIFNKDGRFDLNDYLTNVYQTNRLFASSGSNPNIILRPEVIHQRLDDPSQDDLAEPIIQQFRFPGKKGSRNASPVPTRPNELAEAERVRNLTPEQVAEEKERVDREIREAIENQEVAKLRKHLLKLKRELVYAPKKPPKSEEEDALENQPDPAPSMEKVSPTLLGSYSKKDKGKGKTGPGSTTGRPVRGVAARPDPKSATKRTGK